MQLGPIEFSILIWTICAVVAWWIAHTKGAPDAGTWAFVGLLLGPIGVLLAIAMAKPAKPSATETSTVARASR